MKISIGDFKGVINTGADFKVALDYIEFVRRSALQAIGVSFPANHIFDEEKSVRWNREAVVASNNTKQLARELVAKDYSSMLRTFDDAVKVYCQEYLGKADISNEVISNLIAYLDETFLSAWPNKLDTTLDLIKAFL